MGTVLLRMAGAMLYGIVPVFVFGESIPVLYMEREVLGHAQNRKLYQVSGGGLNVGRFLWFAIASAVLIFLFSFSPTTAHANDLHRSFSTPMNTVFDFSGVSSIPTLSYASNAINSKGIIQFGDSTDAESVCFDASDIEKIVDISNQLSNGTDGVYETAYQAYWDAYQVMQ